MEFLTLLLWLCALAEGIICKPGIPHWRFDADKFDAWAEAQWPTRREAC